MGNLTKANQKRSAEKKILTILKEFRKKLSVHEIQEVLQLALWRLIKEENERNKNAK